MTHCLRLIALTAGATHALAGLVDAAHRWRKEHEIEFVRVLPRGRKSRPEAGPNLRELDEGRLSAFAAEPLPELLRHLFEVTFGKKKMAARPADGRRHSEGRPDATTRSREPWLRPAWRPQRHLAVAGWRVDGSVSARIATTQLTRSNGRATILAMRATATMAYDVIEGVFVVVHGKPAPSDEEWDDYLAFYRDKAQKCKQMLVVTEGGGPNAKQRAKTNENTKDTALIVAVCTDATLVYGIVTALSWFNSQIKVFAQSRIGDALVYLKVPPKAADNIKSRVPAIRAKIAS